MQINILPVVQERNDATRFIRINRTVDDARKRKDKIKELEKRIQALEKQIIK